MSLFIFNLIKTELRELNTTKCCIWCKEQKSKNKGHIFSKRLIKTNNANNVLKDSVCESCNSFFGKTIEDWFLKYSPLGVWTQQYFQPDVIQLKSLKYVPNLFWSDTYKEWILFNHDDVPDIIGTQLILNTAEELLLIYNDVSGELTREGLRPIEDKFYQSAIENKFTKYITDKLPYNFNPRLFLFKNEFILVAISESDGEKLLKKVNQKQDINKQKEESFTRTSFKSLDRLTINYYWSIQRYMKWCAKLAFEFLCLYKDASFCLRKEFNDFRIQILKNNKYDKHIIPFEEKKGLRVNRLTAPGWLSYVNYKKSIKGFPLIGTERPHRHKIFIYESDGYLLATVQLFNIEPCQLVIAKSISLQEIYYTEYDYINDTLEFYISNKDINKRYSSERYLEVLNIIDNTPDTIPATFYSKDDRPFFK
jgi:hypothetical protein